MKTPALEQLRSGLFEDKGTPHDFDGPLAGLQIIAVGDQWEQLQPVVMERVQRIVASIRSGQFPVYNEDKDCTKSCPCRSICRIGQIRSLEKVWEQPIPLCPKA